MTIDTSGKWWVGSEPADVEEYLKAFKAEGYDVDRFKLARCQCKAESFHLAIDDDEGAARRTCSACGAEGFIGDSGKYFANTTQSYECVECHSLTCNVGVGFSLYELNNTDVRWLSVGVRCSQCGVLGCMIDWKVGGGNDPDFLERV
ncbi:MAG: hypothetical protein J0L81_17565 [Caulobacterales bacterium]|jgi:hypothetical protein|nr:hypothetical protein [Caulobacterales bacterium]